MFASYGMYGIIETAVFTGLFTQSRYRRVDKMQTTNDAEDKMEPSCEESERTGVFNLETILKAKKHVKRLGIFLTPIFGKGATDHINMIIDTAQGIPQVEIRHYAKYAAAPEKTPANIRVLLGIALVYHAIMEGKNETD